MELWQAVLIAFGGNAALLLVLGFLGRSLLNNALDKDLEKFKGQLQLSAIEHEVRFSRLHEKRAEVIAELYKLLVEATWEAESFTTPMEWAGEADKKEKYVTAEQATPSLSIFGSLISTESISLRDFAPSSRSSLGSFEHLLLALEYGYATSASRTMLQKRRTTHGMQHGRK